MGLGGEVGGAGAGTGGAGAAVSQSCRLVFLRRPEVAGVDAATGLPGCRAPLSLSGRRRCGRGPAWRGGGDRAQTRERGEYPVYLVWPACDCDDPGAARGLCVSVRVGSPSWNCPLEKPSEVSVSGKAAGFRCSLSFLLRTMLPEIVGLLVYFYLFKKTTKCSRTAALCGKRQHL